MKFEDHVKNLIALAPSHPDSGVKQNFSNFMARFVKAAIEEVEKDPDKFKEVLKKFVAERVPESKVSKKKIEKENDEGK